MVRLKGRRFNCHDQISPRFQFQNGAIKSRNLSDLKDSKTCFNSKMVRLKDDHTLAEKMLREGFNSKMVRLKDSCIEMHEGIDRVSIPKWCD